MYNNNRITTISTAGRGTIIVLVSDPDKDVTKLEITATDDFNDGYYWEIHSDEFEKWYIDIYFNFDKLSSEEKAYLVNYTSSLNFRLQNAKGNKSKTYTLENLTFTY